MKPFLADIRGVLDVVDSEAREIDSTLLKVLMLAEDRRYFFHIGLDPVAICRAIFRRLVRGKIEGASTIEAQLFRTISGRREMRVSRKIREAASAIAISISRPKSRIAAAYLSNAYFGFEKPGISFASQALGYEIVDLNVFAACDLVARLKRPSRLPLDHPQNVLLRQRFDWLFFSAQSILVPTRDLMEMKL